MGLKPVIDEPSKPIPPSKASASSVALIENALSWPRMSVNQRRTKRISRSLTSEITSSGVSAGWVRVTARNLSWPAPAVIRWRAQGRRQPAAGPPIAALTVRNRPASVVPWPVA